MIVKLRDAFDLQMGKTPSRSVSAFWNGDHKWVSIGDIGNADKYISSTKECISEEGVIASGIKVVPENTVIMSFKLSIGKVAITSEDIYTNEAIMAFIDRKKYPINVDYLYHLLSSIDWAEGTNKAVMGLTLNKATLSEKEICLPSIDEQLRVAFILNKVDKLISLRKKQLIKLDELVKAKFVEMFGDPIKNPNRWPVHQMSEFIQFMTSGSRGWAQYFSSSGELFLTIKNVKNCSISLDNVQHIIPPNNAEAKRTKVQEGDLLISITADLGRTGVVSKEIAEYGAYINQHLTCIRLDKERIVPLYAAHFLESPAGKRQFDAKNQNAVKAGLNFDSINTLQLFVPPLSMQNAFVEYLKNIEKSRLTILAGLGKLETLKKALMQKYFG